MEEKKKKKSKTDWLGSVGLSLILTAVVFLVWFFMNGETTITGEAKESSYSPSLSCEREGKNYPIFEYDSSSGKKTEVRVLFNGEKMGAISLIHSLSYADFKEADKSKTFNHGAMNISFQNGGLGADAFNATYSAQNDKMQMTLYATDKEYNEVAARYFLAEGTNKRTTMDKFAEVYSEQGFDCRIVE